MRKATLALLICLTGVGVMRASQSPDDESQQALQQLRGRLAGHENDPAEMFFTNVSILRGKPAGRLPGMMQALGGVIGVPCSYCHVQGNWASEDKPAKRTARAHFAMIARLNKEEFGGENKVSCWSCHRGSPHVPISGG